MKDKTRTHVEH